MAMVFTPQDAHIIMNAIVKQATGQQSITVVDASTFVSAGELVLNTGIENVYNALNIVLGRTYAAARPYKAKLTLMDAMNTGVYSNRLRKISYYASANMAAGNVNTNLYTNLAQGYTSGENSGASTKSQWEQNRKYLLESNFGNTAAWQFCVTRDEEAVRAAFRDENEFITFLQGYDVEYGNDIESTREAWNRLVLLNKIAAVYSDGSDMPGSVVNLTTAFNTKYGTNYTSDALRTTHLKEFLSFFVETFKLASEHMTERSVNYHKSMKKTVSGEDFYILRHTPYADQHVYLFDELFISAEANVLPEIFNPEYLDINTQYERVTYWQSIDSRAEINIKPALIDATGKQIAGDAVNLKYVVGLITDRDGLMTNMQLDRVDTTPLEARKHYRNTWYSFMRGGMCDNTENAILFYMDDSDVTPDEDEGSGE